MESMKLRIALVLALLAGCTGLPPAEMRERPVVATWSPKTEPLLTAQCIARDIETEFYSDGARAAVYPGAMSGAYEVFHYAPMDAIVFRWEDLRAMFTVEPDGTGSKVFYRQAFNSVYYRERVLRAAKNWKCVK